MLETELDDTLSPSSRLSRMAALSGRGLEDGSGKVSLGVARQHPGGARNSQRQPLGPVVPDAVASVEVGLKAASRQVGGSPDQNSGSGQPMALSQPLPSQSEREIVAALSKLDERLAAIAISVEFTEAYVSAGITNKLGELLVKELVIAEKAIEERSDLQARLRTAGFIILAMLGLLAAEIRFDFLGDYLTSALVWSQTAAQPLMAWSEPIRASLGSWFDR